MYTNNLPFYAACAEEAITKSVHRYGVSVYVDTDSDWSGADFVIAPDDQEGLKIFREFAAKISAHYNTLKIVS
jgi:hypothetical protein